LQPMAAEWSRAESRKTSPRFRRSSARPRACGVYSLRPRTKNKIKPNTIKPAPPKNNQGASSALALDAASGTIVAVGALIGASATGVDVRDPFGDAVGDAFGATVVAKPGLTGATVPIKRVSVGAMFVAGARVAAGNAVGSGGSVGRACAPGDVAMGCGGADVGADVGGATEVEGGTDVGGGGTVVRTRVGTVCGAGLAHATGTRFKTITPAKKIPNQIMLRVRIIASKLESLMVDVGHWNVVPHPTSNFQFPNRGLLRSE